MKTAWKAVPLVLDWSKEDQMIKLPLIENYVEDSSNPVARAFVRISTPDLQVYRSTIHIDAHFHGLRQVDNSVGVLLHIIRYERTTHH